MSANQYFPPLNQAGILLPQLPNDPALHSDLAYAEDNVDRLNWSNNPNGVAATDDEVGQAVAYKAGLSFAAVPLAGAPPAAPAWVQGLYNFLNNEFGALLGEQAVLLANSQAGNGAPLYDPTLPGQWVFLVAPNPTSRDNLMGFDYMQCIASAGALGLPPLPPAADLPSRKRQIAGRIGVAMC